jgi:hypothetical protein
MEFIFVDTIDKVIAQALEEEKRPARRPTRLPQPERAAARSR